MEKGKSQTFYIALPKGSKFKCYKVEGTSDWQFTHGVPPYHRVVGMDSDGELELREVKEGSHEYGALQKWVGHPRVRKENDIEGLRPRVLLGQTSHGNQNQASALVSRARLVEIIANSKLHL